MRIDRLGANALRRARRKALAKLEQRLCARHADDDDDRALDPSAIGGGRDDEAKGE